jgi:ATP-dependent helicase/nuclease subunit B
VGVKKDGDFTATSRIVSKEIMDMMLREAVDVARREAEEILGGRVSVSPYSGTCKYCPYSNACGMDRKIPGYKVRNSGSMKRADAIAELCRKYDNGNGSGAEDVTADDSEGED